MSSIQHVYRRGYTFWWRRVLRLGAGRPLHIRLSLKTADRQRARELGAVLTAATEGVKAMLQERITRRSDERPTEAELQAIAKAEFEYQLGWFCDRQRQTPQNHAMHSAVNHAYADYYQRLIDTGGSPELSPGDEALLAAKGFTAERIVALKELVEHHSDRPAVQPRTAAIYLRKLGFEPGELLQDVVLRALYPAFRDAVLAAEDQLQAMIAGSLFSAHSARPPSEATQSKCAAVIAPPSGSMLGAPAMIADVAGERLEPIPVAEFSNPTFAELCNQAADDCLMDERWTSKTARQRRSLGLLFELLVGEKRLNALTQADLSAFKAKRRLITEKLSPGSERDRQRILELVSRAAKPQELTDGPHAKTINRDLTAISAVLKWGVDNGKAVPAGLNPTGLRVPLPTETRARDDRPPTSAEDLQKLFSLPVFSGCLPHSGGTGRTVLRHRFTAGTAIVHDAFYWVPLIVNYTGIRREEGCKLRPVDFDFSGDIPFVRIDFTETGRLKNAQSKRNLPLHRELLRLGLREYVEEAIRRGYDVLFPELTPTNAVESYGDQFYDLCWTHMRKHAGLSSAADIHGMRHAFNSDLKQKRVSKEFRRDMLGHAGEGQTDERYSTAAELGIMLEEIEKLPVLTGHLRWSKLNMPPRAERRPNRICVGKEGPCAAHDDDSQTMRPYLPRGAQQPYGASTRSGRT